MTYDVWCMKMWLSYMMMLYDDVYDDMRWWCMIIWWRNIVWWWDELTWCYSISRWSACIEYHDALWWCYFLRTTLIEVNDDKHMMTNIYIVLSVTYKRCIGLCHEDNLKMKVIGTSCIVCVHIRRDTSPFMMMSTNTYAMMMMMIMPRMTLRGLLTFGCRYKQLTRLWWV